MGILSAIAGALPVVSGITEVIGGITGILGSKKDKEKSPRDNLLSQAQGAREAAEKYGFNPLTMLQLGQTGGSLSGGGGAPPLASIDLLTSGLRGLDDIASGDAARRRQADQLELDLAKIKLDQMRSGVLQVTEQASHGVGTGPSPLGRASGVYSQSNVQPAGPRYVSSNVSRSASPINVDSSRDLSHNAPNADHPLRDSLGDIPMPDPTLDRGTGGYIGGLHLKSAPGYSPSTVWEENHGDVMQEVMGVSKIAADLLYTNQQLEKDRAADAAKRPRPALGPRDRNNKSQENARRRARVAPPGAPVNFGMGGPLAFPPVYPLAY